MDFIIYNKVTKSIERITDKYPRKDISEPLEGAADYQLYVIDHTIPAFDELKQTVKVLPNYALTTEKYLNHSHILIATKYQLIDKTKDEVIEALNDSLGKHLDTSYPFWEQNKHSGRALRYISSLSMGGTPTAEETNYINRKVVVLADWASRCRVERDNREKEYRDNDIFPSFEWEARPLT